MAVTPLAGAFLGSFPFVVAIPGRGLADLARLFVNGRVDIGRSRLQTGAEDGHVQEGGADIDDDLRTGFADQRAGGGNVQSVEFVSFQNTRLLQRLLGMHGCDDVVAFGFGARGDMYIAENIIVLSALMRHHLSDTSGADDENSLFHLIKIPSLDLGGVRGSSLKTDFARSPGMKTHEQRGLFRPLP